MSAASVLAPYARRHRPQLVRGLALTAVLVACRLALPLPLAGIVGQSTAAHAPSVSRATWLACGFVALALAAGAAEYVARLAFANFANRTVGDVRDAASAALDDGPAAGDREQALTQVVADSGRLKSGLKGVLNHIVLNALIVAGATVAVLVVDPWLGGVLLLGVLALTAVGWLGGRHVAHAAQTHRTEEAGLAHAVHRWAAARPEEWTADAMDQLHRRDEESGRADVGLTAWEGRCTWVAHVVLSVTLAAVLLLGAHEVTTGTLGPAGLFTVGGYLLTVHGPGVRLVRQQVRVGGLVVNAEHLAGLLRPARPDRVLLRERSGVQ